MHLWKKKQVMSKEASNQGLKPDEIHWHKRAKLQDWGYESCSYTTKENQGCSTSDDNMQMKCFGGSLSTGLFNRSRVSFRQRQDPLQPTEGKTDLDGRNWTDVDSV